MGKLIYKLKARENWDSSTDPTYVMVPSVTTSEEWGKFYLAGTASGKIPIMKLSSALGRLVVYGGFLDGKWHEIGYFNTEEGIGTYVMLTGFVFTANQEVKNLMSKSAFKTMRLNATGKSIRFVKENELVIEIDIEEINKKSDFTVTSNVEAGNGIAGEIFPISNTNRHKVTLFIGNKSHEISLSAGSSGFSYTIPMDWCNAISHSDRGQAVCKVETIDAQGKSLGTTQKNFTIMVPSSVVPTIGTFALKPQNPNNALGNQYIQGKSKLLAQFTCGLAYGSPIASWTVEGAGVSKTGSGAPSAAQWLEIGTLIVAGAGKVMTLTLTDGRGRKTAKSLTIDVAGYAVPKIYTAQVFRCNAEGVADEEGTSVLVKATWSHTALGGVNTVEARAKYKGRKDSVWIDQGVLNQGTGKVIGAGQFLSTGEYDVAIDLKDLFGTVTTVYPINVEKVVFDLQEDRAAFGMRGIQADALQIPEKWMPNTRRLLLDVTEKVNSSNINDPKFWREIGGVSTAYCFEISASPKTPSAYGTLINITAKGDGVQIWTNIYYGEVYTRSYNHNGFVKAGEWNRVYSESNKETVNLPDSKADVINNFNDANFWRNQEGVQSIYLSANQADKPITYSNLLHIGEVGRLGTGVFRHLLIGHNTTTGFIVPEVLLRWSDSAGFDRNPSKRGQDAWNRVFLSDIRIPRNTDLNDLLIPGVYRCTNEDSPTILNSPYTEAYTIMVLKNSPCTQVIFTYGYWTNFFYFRSKTENTWGKWSKVTGTFV